MPTLLHERISLPFGIKNNQEYQVGMRSDLFHSIYLQDPYLDPPILLSKLKKSRRQIYTHIWRVHP